MNWRQWLWILPLLILPLSVSFFSSGLELESDNLKYMGMAWGMLHSGDYIIPVANGVPYTDKPPLLFWMIALCWHMFGTHMLVLQCLICVLMATWVLLTQATYATLFPNDSIGKYLLPYLMIGCFAFLGYAHFLHVDLFLVIGVLLTNLGIFKRLCSTTTSNSTTRFSSLCIILGIFIGLFAKGPVIYIFTLLPLLFNVSIQREYRRYVLRIFAEIALSTVLFFLAWVLPVIFNANHEFLQQILYKQIADRAVSESDKSHFFYVLKLPYLLIPWAINIVFIRKLSTTISEIWKKNSLTVLIIIVGFLVLSFFGQKRFWYLLPCIPYGLIILTRFFVLYKNEKNVFWLNFLLFFTIFLVLAVGSIGICCSPHQQQWILHGIAETASLSPAIYLSILTVSLLILIYLLVSSHNLGLIRLLKISGLLLALIYFALSPYFFALAEEDDQLQLMKTTLRQVRHHDDVVIFAKSNSVYGFNYLAEILVIPVLSSESTLQQWLMKHPRGIVIVSARTCPAPTHLMISSHEMGDLAPL